MKKHILKRIGALGIALLMMLGCCASAAAANTKPDKVIDPSKPVTLTLHKYEMEELPTTGVAGDGTTNVAIPDGAKPLENAVFAVYKVADDFHTKNEDGVYEIPSDAVCAATGTTDGAGTVVFDKLEQGRYLVVEQSAPNHVYEMSPSFLVDLPMVLPDGSGWNYDVHAYPKNAAVLGSAVLIKTGEEADAKGLSGAVFKLQRKNADGRFVDVKTNIATGEGGKLVLNNLIKGEYQLIETKAPDGYGINTTPITFTIDKNGEADEDGSKISGKIVALSFHNARTPIEPQKEVDKESAAIDETVTWTITPSIPSDIATYKNYVVKDQLDDRLTFVSAKVVIGDGTSEANEDITSQCKVEAKDQLVTVDLTGCKEALTGKEVKIILTTTINENVLENPGLIDNKAEVEFENEFGTSGKVESPKVDVFTGTLKVLKINENKEKLQGASFALYETLQDAKKGEHPISSEGKTEQTTGADGLVSFKGLKAGTYYLVETKAPMYEKNGQKLSYNLMTEPKEVVIEESKEGVTEITVVNKKQGFSIPITGSSGTVLMVSLGTLLISGAVMLLMLRKKRVV